MAARGNEIGFSKGGGLKIIEGEEEVKEWGVSVRGRCTGVEGERRMRRAGRGW